MTDSDEHQKIVAMRRRIGLFHSLDTKSQFEMCLALSLGQEYVSSLPREEVDGMLAEFINMEKPDVTTVRETINAIITDHLGIPDPTAYSDDASWVDDLGADSLDAVEIVMSAEERFNIEISEKEADQISSIGDMIALINRKRDE